MDTKMKIVVVVGARPQFIKHAAFELEAKKYFELVTIHTGQHYDQNMSQVFFDELKISPPSYLLDIRSGDHGYQTGKMMIEIESILKNEKPDIVLVYGDTNSTLAGALVASKLKIKVAHIEAGLRSYNRDMPEEINRVLTDHISSFLFCPTQQAVTNLKNEGINNKVFMVGDVMCDMIRIAKENQMIVSREDKGNYFFATIHRPYNTDDPERLMYILNSLNRLSLKVILSLHPRTKNFLLNQNIQLSSFSNIEFIPPVSYFESLSLQDNSKAVITDSGGMQKEAYLLKRKCITIRSETEWIETLSNNWNTLVFEDLDSMETQLNVEPGKYDPNIYGDGFTSSSIVNIMRKSIN